MWVKPLFNWHGRCRFANSGIMANVRFFNKGIVKVTAQETDWLEVSRVETLRANQAEWRARAIRATRRGFTHLMLAYAGNEAMLEQIGALREAFNTLCKGRAAKLDEIARTSREKAARAVEFGVNRE